MPRYRPRRALLLVAIALVGSAAALGVTLVPLLGMWLVVADPLVPSDAVVVLAGRTPLREIEAAAVYHRKLAPLVILSNGRDPQETARRIARMPEGRRVARDVLVNLGVPERAILALEPVVENTAEELAVVAGAGRDRGFRRVILITSASHTRRVRLIWDAQDAALEALVYPAGYDAFEARRWWRSRHGIETVVHELGGIVNFRLGSRLPTFDDGR